MTMQQVWYASYGSNMDARRFGCYLAGGRPPGAVRGYPGCRDTTPPSASRAVELPGEVYFAWQSPTWGGGVAFFDPDADATSVGRAYRITVEQFADVVEQEMGRDPGAVHDISDVLTGAPVLRLGPGHYETLHVVGQIDGDPVITFSASWDHAAVDLNSPAEAYLQTMARGLSQMFDWQPEESARYLASRPGVHPRTFESLACLVSADTEAGAAPARRGRSGTGS